MCVRCTHQAFIIIAQYNRSTRILAVWRIRAHSFSCLYDLFLQFSVFSNSNEIYETRLNITSPSASSSSMSVTSCSKWTVMHAFTAPLAHSTTKPRLLQWHGYGGSSHDAPNRRSHRQVSPPLHRHRHRLPTKRKSWNTGRCRTGSCREAVRTVRQRQSIDAVKA